MARISNGVTVKGDVGVTERKVLTVGVHIPDEVIDAIRDAEQVELQLYSRAIGRDPAPIRLSYTTVRRLTVDDA